MDVKVASNANAMSPQQLNSLGKMLVQQKAVRMQQRIYSRVVDPSAEPQITVQPRNVGLILGFYVKVKATITNTGAGPSLAATDFGPANMLSRIAFTDLENNERINTPGWHLALVNAVKARRPFGMSLVKSTGEDDPLGFGSVYTVHACPDVPTAAGPETGIRSWTYIYWVPLAYSEQDFRGAIFANVVNATMQLNLTFNPSPIAAAPANDLGYVATGTTGTMTDVQVDVHQVYLDQLPRGQNGGVILPVLDLATVYELKQTIFTGISSGQDFPMDYPNFRDFLSTFAVYFNGAARTPGTDINQWSLQSANFTNIWQMPPDIIALQTRNHLGVDVPKGCYYFGSRQKPIATVQYGNMQLVMNPSVAGAGAQVYLAYEDFALKNAVVKAGSIG